MDSCTRAYSTVQQLLCHGGYCELILSLVRTSCRLLFTAHPTARSLNTLRDVVRSRNLSKSTLAHDAVATVVLQKHHPIKVCQRQVRGRAETAGQKFFEKRVQVVEKQNMYQGHKYIKRKAGARHSIRSRIAPFQSQKYTRDKESSTRNKLTSCQSHQECHRKRSHLQVGSRRRLGRPSFVSFASRSPDVGIMCQLFVILISGSIVMSPGIVCGLLSHRYSAPLRPTSWVVGPSTRGHSRTSV